ncbi:MAG: hypothetical protein JOZ41_06165 [Chloroflexi bacterium]|nr:hypothetical protein [Chloroflexota bacterium]
MTAGARLGGRGFAARLARRIEGMAPPIQPAAAIEDRPRLAAPIAFPAALLSAAPLGSIPLPVLIAHGAPFLSP